MSKRPRTHPKQRFRKKKHSADSPPKAPSPGSLEALLQQALQAQAAGQMARAHELFTRVLARQPNHHQALFALGQIAAQMGNLVEGVKRVQQAIAAEGSEPQVMYRVALADMLMEKGEGENALKIAESAVALAGTTVGPPAAYAHCILAVCFSRFHRIEEALVAGTRANALLPGDLQIGVILARLLRRSGRPAEGLAILRNLENRSAGSWATQKALYHELGMTLDKLGEYDAAYEAFRKYGMKMAGSPAARRTNRRIALEDLARFKKNADNWGPPLCTKADFPTAPDNQQNPPLAFLVGFPRSGTTMTEQVLAAHSGIITGDEWPLLAAMGDEAGRRLGGHPQDHFPEFNLELVRELREFYWEKVDEALAQRKNETRDGRMFLDKLPLNIVNLALITRVFPDARIIVALRDPRDVCLSCFMQDFRLNESMIQFLSLPNTVRMYHAVMDYYLMLRDKLQLDRLEIRYEDTVADLEGQARRLLEYLGLAWDADVLKFHEAARKRFITTPSFEAVTQPVHRGAIGRWRNYQNAFAPELETLERFVKAFGYE